MSLSPELLARLKLVTLSPETVNLGHIRLVIILVLSHPKYLADLPTLLQNIALDCILPVFPSGIRDSVLTYNQSRLVTELAFQVYRYLRFGRELDETRPSFDMGMILDLTLNEANKLWKPST